MFCVAHAEKIQAHVAASQWSGNVKFIISTKAATVGDALRRVHDENVIETDFILCHADVVANFSVAQVLHRHRLRKEADPTVLMTTVFKKATPTHASRSFDDDTVVGLSMGRENELSNGEILYWENSPDTPSVEIDPMLILNEGSGSMQLRYDLLDTHIDVCSVEVLQLFKDNFDYQSLRHDFMTGVLGDDITDHRMYAHVVHTEYAARVKDLRTYASVSHDVIRRWAAPILVDNSLMDPNSSYRLNRGFVYRDKNVKSHPRSKIGPDVVLGSGTTIGAGSVISKTVIGRGCTIGENCTISNSFIWSNVTIESGSVIEWSILCNNVRIHLGTTIGKGSILSYGVAVGPKQTLKPHTRLTLHHVNNDVTRNIDLGDKGKGFLWVTKDDDLATSAGLQSLYVSANVRVRHGDGGDDGGSDDELDGGVGVSSGSAPGSGAAGALAGDDDGEVESDDAVSGPVGNEFDLEVREIVLEGVQGGASVDNMALEINGRKFAHDKTFFECVRCILWALLASVPESTAPGKPLLTALQKLLKKYQALLQKFLQDGEQVELLWTLQEYLEHDHGRFKAIFQFIVHTLYDLDLLDEDSIWAWEKEQAGLVGDDRAFLNQCAKFLEWLRTADDDDE